MLTREFPYTASKLMLVVLSVLATFAGSAVYGGSFDPAAGSGTDECELSLLLQKSPYREEYAAKLATEVGNYWAANEAAVASDAQEESGWFALIFGKRSAGKDPGDIDTFSKDCLSCHDGIRASEITVSYRNAPDSFGSGRHFRGKDHPIGMDYERYVAFSGGKYKTMPTLNSKMRLISGKVGCLTCHNPFNPERKHLVMSDYKSALCLTCHNK